jgi:hypothetical protein
MNGLLLKMQRYLKIERDFLGIISGNNINAHKSLELF